MKYRFFMILAFFILEVSVIVLFGLNLSAKNRFGYHISAIDSEKLLKNKFSNLLLATLGTYTIGNLPYTFDLNDI
jgi:hypothetical protein